jgi:hypothetical protein
MGSLDGHSYKKNASIASTVFEIAVRNKARERAVLMM